MLSFFAALVIFPLATACGGSGSEPTSPSGATDVTVSVSQDNLELDYTSQTVVLTITCSSDWGVKTDASWISIRPSGGIKNAETELKITVEANNTLDSRSADINITGGNRTLKSIKLNQGYKLSAVSSLSSLTLSGENGAARFTVTANGEWSLTADMDWIKISPSNGNKGETEVNVTAEANEEPSIRKGALILSCGDDERTIEVTQLNYNIDAPEGYHLVWNDEFDKDGKPGADWVIENQPAGWVNNELQTYTSREVDGKLTLEVKDGFLHINCFKGSDGKVYSGRMNAKPSTGWTYGYVEARINLPKGKGTWPAFWMMPSNVDWNTNPWPNCGEIDIMEEVGVDANRVSSSLHTGKYNHMIGTQKTHEMYLAGAEGEFHVYALEWTENQITTYVDGKVQLSVSKSEMGSDHNSWPFHYAFYPILNLAWGGDWGGYAGVNENALPVTMLVDYVRIFQKN